MRIRNNELFGAIYIVIASVIWGTTGTAASFAPDISPLAIGAFAMGGGGVLLLCTSFKQLKKDTSLLISQTKILLLGGLSVAIYPLAFYSSMHLAGVAVGTVISLATAPLFSVILERVINKKPINTQWVISFCFGGLGIVLLTIGKQSDHHTTIHLWGVLLGLIAALTYACYSWSAKQMIEYGVSSKSSMASMFGLAAIVLLPSLIFTGENIFSNPTNLTVVIYMATIPMFIGYLLFGYGLVYIEASKATLITLLEPAIATLFAIYIVGERFSYIGWTGMLLIGICSVLQVLKTPSFSLATQ